MPNACLWSKERGISIRLVSSARDSPLLSKKTRQSILAIQIRTRGIMRPKIHAKPPSTPLAFCLKSRFIRRREWPKATCPSSCAITAGELSAVTNTGFKFLVKATGDEDPPIRAAAKTLTGPTSYIDLDPRRSSAFASLKGSSPRRAGSAARSISRQALWRCATQKSGNICSPKSTARTMGRIAEFHSPNMTGGARAMREVGE